jgi:hypothetical protein
MPRSCHHQRDPTHAANGDRVLNECGGTISAEYGHKSLLLLMGFVGKQTGISRMKRRGRKINIVESTPTFYVRASPLGM